MLVSRFALFTLLCVLFGNVVALRAAEPAVSEIAGLELWLDAQQEAAQRLSAPGSAFKSGEPISQWRDASGGKRMAVQTDAAGQPKLVQVGARADDAAAGAGWVVRFDGEDDHLRVLGMNRRYTSFTLFVVAAPHSNSGRFRGFLAFNQKNRKDYETGFNLDMNSRFSPKLQDLNLEGRGFGGARNLLKSTVPFGTLHVMEVVADATNKNVRLVFDGKPAGRREFSPSELIADDLTIGARHYENNAAPQRVQGFLHGDVAEVLLFDRVLTEGETRSVRAYLDRKYATLRKALPRGLKLASAAENIEPLVIVENPPSVQMLVPGFRVRELPVELTNINNLRYRPDGKLYALGYNGDVWLLNDVDGDGLEEAKTPFFENRGRLRGPIGMAVIPTGHALLQDADRKPRTGAQGVVVASKGKISALLDADGDDVAEEERVIATGWKEISQNVDAIGVAFDPKDGAIYFGLGTAAYNNAYLLDEAGRSAFDLGSERGTVQRIAPDLSGRTTVCTGVRFTIGMDFSDDNQLFVTDQEGATWLPNGNPFDELLHITPGRHYGFPPRHPKHLPRVFDEPSLFDYGPQHQSTCGMVFNRPFQSKGPIFGPAHWRGDVLVCGESRGKLYRTQLVRDADNEYVAHNHLIGCLGMLTVDCCISPRGDLVVACHSGGPDWGTGPTGIGKLFAIRYDDESPPQPTAVWAAGPQEVRVAFDRPLDPVRLKNLAPQTKIVYGEYVAAGDRFESIRPGYAVTQRQQSTPRHRLPVHGASITPDRRTLILSTAPHPAAVQYALTLPGLGREIKKPHAGELPQHAQVDLAYSLGGVRARWTPTDASQPEWSGWLPHLDLHVARALASDDAEQRRFWKVMEQPGRLTLETQIDPRGLFAPAVQPGSTLGYDAKTVETWVRQRGVLIQSDRSFILTTAGATTAQASVHKEGAHQVTLGVQQGQTRPLRFTLELKTGGATPVLRPSWSATLGDDRERSGSLALHRFLLPWAKTDSADLAVPAPQIVGALANASWGRGRRVFYSEEAGCSKCHVVHGKGGQVGPDLSNLTHRDYVSVLRDVTQPSFAINPDYITFIAATKDGRVLTGPIRSEGADVLIGDEDGKVTKLALVDIEELKPSSLSVMPEGIPKKLGPEKTKDLLAFLLRKPPRMPQDAELPAPAPRTRSEVSAVLAGAKTPDDLKPLNVLLVAGKKDHGPGEHDYPAWLKAWSELLRGAEELTVDTAMEWPSNAQIEAADTIAFFQKGAWTDERAKAIDAHLAKGGGLIYIHWAVEGGPQAPAFAQRIGLASHAAKLKYRHGPLDLGFETGRDHPIGRNFDRVHFHDESYWLMQGDRSKIRVIATGIEDAEPRPLFWTFEPKRGRVFVSILGHYSWTFDDPLFRILLLRGLAWSAREPVDRFNDLSVLGARLAE